MSGGGQAHLAVGGRRCAVLRRPAAAAGAPTFVLLHEGLGSVSIWRDFPELLAARTGFGVFAYSRLGYGGSDPEPLPRPLTYFDDEARDTLPALLDAAGVGDHLLVGHSDGGSIAAVHAGLHADARLRGAVLIAPHFFVEPVTVAGVRSIAAAFREGGLRDRLARHHGANLDHALEGWRGLWLDPGFAAWNAGAALSRLTVPILMIQERGDPHGSLDQVDYLTQRVPHAETLILPGQGHTPHLDQAETVLEAVAAFARRCMSLPGRSRSER